MLNTRSVDNVGIMLVSCDMNMQSRNDTNYFVHVTPPV